MSILPDRKSIEDFADSMIEHDRYVKCSIEEGYMTRKEYIITTWINSYCNVNSEGQGIEAWRSHLPEACSEASKLFEIPIEKAKDLYEKSRSIRSRHMNPE